MKRPCVFWEFSAPPSPPPLRGSSSQHFFQKKTGFSLSPKPSDIPAAAAAESVNERVTRTKNTSKNELDLADLKEERPHGKLIICQSAKWESLLANWDISADRLQALCCSVETASELSPAETAQIRFETKRMGDYQFSIYIPHFYVHIICNFKSFMMPSGFDQNSFKVLISLWRLCPVCITSPYTLTMLLLFCLLVPKIFWEKKRSWCISYFCGWFSFVFTL